MDDSTTNSEFLLTDHLDRSTKGELKEPWMHMNQISTLKKKKSTLSLDVLMAFKMHSNSLNKILSPLKIWENWPSEMANQICPVTHILSDYGKIEKPQHSYWEADKQINRGEKM